MVYLPTFTGHLWGKCWDSYSSTMDPSWDRQSLMSFGYFTRFAQLIMELEELKDQMRSIGVLRETGSPRGPYLGRLPGILSMDWFKGKLEPETIDFTIKYRA